MQYKVRTERLSRIETDKDAYRITTGDDLTALTASIETAGLINPPLLMPAGGETFTVVCGFRRILACRSLGWKRVEARVLSADTPPLKCALAAIADNCSQRELNLVETARAVKMLADNLPDDGAVAATARKAGLPVAPPLIDKLKSLDQLPAAFREGLIDGTLSLPMARRLQRLSMEDASEVFDLFREIRAGLNIQREILDNANESSLREGVRLAEILRSDALMSIRTTSDLDRSSKTARIRKWLKERRYPALSAAEARFEMHVQALDLPRDVQLGPPAGFEGPDYTLALKFSSRAQLRDQIEAIDRLLKGDVLRKILG